MNKSGVGVVAVVVLVVVAFAVGAFIFAGGDDAQLGPKSASGSGKDGAQAGGGGGPCYGGTCDTCLGDFDGSGNVGPADLAQVLGAWGLCPGNENITCSSDADCPPITTEYCNSNGSACSNTQIFECQNPGTQESECVQVGGGGGCGPCPNGCEDGECLPQGNETNMTLPDLIISAINEVSSGCGAGNGTNVTCTVNLDISVDNIGEASAGSSKTRIAVDGSASPLLTTPSIPSGGSVNVPVTISDLSQGNHTAVANADWQNDVTESNENNNELTKIINV